MARNQASLSRPERVKLAAVAKRAASGGFTLLELAVVILIIGVLATFAMLSVGNRVQEDQMENEARRMQALVKLAAEEAEAKGVEIGLRFTESEFRLLVLDENRKWSDLEKTGSLRRRQIPPPVSIGLTVDGRRVVLPANDPSQAELDKEEKSPSMTAAVKKMEPQVLLLSSGELTPFALDLGAPGLGFFYRLEGDVLGRLQLTRIAIPRG
jgi:general secretion pathway protein H